MKDLKTIEIILESKNIVQFQYPKAEEEMIFSVLEGKDYPLSNINNTNKYPIIVDFGSNFGSSIIYFKDNFPNSKIFGYEPSKETFEVLKQNTKSLGNIHIKKEAIWNKKGKFRLNYGPQNRTGSFTLLEWSNDLGGEYVQTTTFHDIVKTENINEIDILKIDIEAVELDVLFNIFSEESTIKIKNIFVEYHGEIVFKEMHNTFSNAYDLIQCNEIDKSQGVILMKLK